MTWTAASQSEARLICTSSAHSAFFPRNFDPDQGEYFPFFSGKIIPFVLFCFFRRIITTVCLLLNVMRKTDENRKIRDSPL